jgi:hypothetical protein
MNQEKLHMIPTLYLGFHSTFEQKVLLCGNVGKC